MAKTTTTPTGTEDRSPWHPQRLRYADALAVAAHPAPVVGRQPG